MRYIRARGKGRWVPLALIGVGALMIVAVGGYYVYSLVARGQLGELDFSTYSEGQDQARGFASIYPGSLVPPLWWDDPRWAGSEYDSYDPALEGFVPIPDGLLAEAGSLTPPVGIEIPGISLVSTVKELEILNYGDARGWETPKDVVGHIPTTANPGEAGNVYLFGHLQSPVRGEGSVFRNLVRIPDLLRQGQPVYVVVHNGEGVSYLYQVVDSKQMPQEEFYPHPSSEALVTMVACVPAYVYDHRLVVTAKLVGMRG